MKIIHVLAGKIWGGAEIYATTLGREQRRLGHQVSFYACDVPIVRQSMPSDIVPHYIDFKGAFDSVSANILSEDLSKMGKEDVLHVHGTNFVYWAMLAKKKANSDVKIILTRHTSRATFISPLFWRSFRNLHKIIFVSDLSRKKWLSVNFWMKKSKCVSILNSVAEVEDTLDAKDSIRKRFIIPENVPVLVFIGRLVTYKGCEVILKALGELKDQNFAFVFVGQGKEEYVSKLKSIAEELKISDKVYFYGYSNDTKSIILESDFGVVPSIIREGCHLVPMEFMKYGKTVIATNNGAQPEFVQNNKTGLLISPDNVIELTSAISLLLDKKSFREEIEKNAKEYFDNNLTYSKFLQEIMNSYQ